MILQSAHGRGSDRPSGPENYNLSAWYRCHPISPTVSRFSWVKSACKCSRTRYDWVNGTIDYAVDAATGSIFYSGDIEISGAYSDTVQIDIQISGGGYTDTYTVNGQTLSL